MSRMPWMLVCLALLGGCVTESTNEREPAPKDEQLQAHLDLARGYLERRDWNRARDPLKRALEIAPRSADAHVFMAVLHQAQDEPEHAEEWYRRALRYEPRHSMALNNYGSFLYSQGRYEEALRPLREVVKDTSYRGRAQAHENLGLAELKVGNVERAQAAFERALSFNTVQPRSALELAFLAFERGDIADAGGYYDIYRQRARQTPRSLCLGLRLARATGDTDQRASYEIALRNMFPDSAEAKRCMQEN